jgi:hypothetical protein
MNLQVKKQAKCYNVLYVYEKVKCTNAFNVFIIPYKYIEMTHIVGEIGVTKLQTTFTNRYRFGCVFDLNFRKTTKHTL